MNRQLKDKFFLGQATIELVISMLGVLLLLFGTVAIFMGLNNSLFQREEVYETDSEYGRARAATSIEENQVDESRVPKLNAFDLMR